jgi:alanine dehydrogenase
MIIGVPKEIKAQEHRVGMVPAGVLSLVRQGHDVVVQQGAGEGAGYTDGEFLEAGARILSGAAEVYAASELVCKVKEPLIEEVPLLQKGQILFCYLHLAPLPELTERLLEAGVNAIALETIQTEDGYLPCLVPMSEIAGRMAVQIAARHLEREAGGRGILLSGASGAEPATVAVIGGGCAGINAARVACGMGARVTVLDIDGRKLAHIDEVYGGRISTVFSDPHSIRKAVAEADAVIGAVLVPGCRAPQLVLEDMIAEMRPGSVIIDISVDQGGCVATCRPTTHEHPTYRVHDVIHYCVPNMPGAVPRTSTQALAHATLPWLQLVASSGFGKAIAESEALRKGVNVYLPAKQRRSVISCKPVAQALGLEYTGLSN